MVNLLKNRLQGLKSRNTFIILFRNKHRKADHWAVLEKKKFASDRALENFDDFYGSVFGIRWKSMRIAMLCEKKYMALVNNFGDVEKTTAMLEMDGAINLKMLCQEIKARSDFENATEEALKTNVTDKTTRIDEGMKHLINRTEQNEIQSLYGDKLEVEDKLLEPLDPKKSLYKALSEDTNIQFDRIINLSNTGALFEYIPATKIKGLEDFVQESDHYRYYSNQVDFPVTFIKDQTLNLPENLHIYTYDKMNTSRYKAPRRCLTNVFSHYLLDGASILPPLVLDVKPGEIVLDACCAPGGKSLILLQTLYPDILVCNDIQESRLNRVKSVMNDFLFDFDQKWNNRRVILKKSNIIESSDHCTYDKILVDAPCTNDRHVLNSNDNNIFKPTRIKERLKIPETQAAILANCIRLLKPGGTLVYSTCSLSPIQNDGVVHMALSTVFKENGISVALHDTSIVTDILSNVFKFENSKGLKYGQLVIPFLPSNFGPMYFCKMTRI